MIVLKNRKAGRFLGFFIPLVLVPAVVAASVCFGSDRGYLFFSLGIVVLSLALFAAGIDKKNIGTRRMVLCAVMTALAVAGRFIPVLKPVSAVIIISGMYLGRESGFLVGAMTALLSNFYFGQGPWTPFQMLAWGLTGYIAGILSEVLRKNKVILLIYGLLSGVFFSLVMDIWTVLWGGMFMADRYLEALYTSLPHTAAYALSGFLFLLIMSGTFCQRLERVKIKYGI